LPVREDASNTKRSGKSAQPPNRTLGRKAIITSAVLVAVIVTLTNWPRGKPVPNESHQSLLNASVMQPPMRDPLLEWDATQIELDATAKAIEHLDAVAEHDLEGLDTNDEPAPP
jgi:hypothetical protein